MLCGLKQHSMGQTMSGGGEVRATITSFPVFGRQLFSERKRVRVGPLIRKRLKSFFLGGMGRECGPVEKPSAIFQDCGELG